MRAVKLKLGEAPPKCIVSYRSWPCGKLTKGVGGGTGQVLKQCVEDADGNAESVSDSLLHTGSSRAASMLRKVSTAKSGSLIVCACFCIVARAHAFQWPACVILARE